MRYFLVLLVLLSITGCNESQKATSSDENQKIETPKKSFEWEGANADDLIAKLGAPTQIIDNGTEGKILVWRKERAFRMGVFSGYTTFHSAKCYTYWVNPQNIVYKYSYAKQ